MDLDEKSLESHLRWLILGKYLQPLCARQTGLMPRVRRCEKDPSLCLVEFCLGQIKATSFASWDKTFLSIVSSVHRPLGTICPAPDNRSIVAINREVCYLHLAIYSMGNRHIVTKMELHSMERIIKEGLLGDTYL